MNKPKLGDYILIKDNRCTYAGNTRSGELWEIISDKEIVGLLIRRINSKSSILDVDILYPTFNGHYELIPKTELADLLYKTRVYENE